MSLNRVILMGKVGEYGPKLSYASSSKAETTFTLLCEDVKDGKTFRTFIPICVIGSRAEHAAEDLEPGDLVLLEGRLSWKAGATKDTGKLQVIAFDVERLLASTRAMESRIESGSRPTMELRVSSEPWRPCEITTPAPGSL
jgi:single-stranded DNA-binding protein